MRTHEVLGCPETMSPEEARDRKIERIAQLAYEAGPEGAVSVDALYNLFVLHEMTEGVEEEDAVRLVQQRFAKAKRAKTLTATLLNHAVTQKTVHVSGAAN